MPKSIFQIYKTVGYILGLVFSLSIFSVPDTSANNINFRVKHYSTEEGLAQNYVDCIYRDSRDFIWVGTWDGLNRFDGYNFITYRPDSKAKNQITDGFINEITEDKNGDLWIATRNGLNKFIFEKEKFIHFQKDIANPNLSISDNHVSTLLFDKENNLWIGTLTGGVEKITFDESLTEIISIKRYKVDLLDKYGLTSENIYCLLQDHNGYIYIGSILGLDRLDPATGEILKFSDTAHPNYFGPTVVHSLYEDKDNILWVGTESGLISIDYEIDEFYKYPVDRSHPVGTNKKAMAHGLIKDIGEDPNGNILIATLGGLYILDKHKKEFSNFPVNQETENSLNTQFINSILCDINGNVWVGTEKGGLNMYNVNQKPFYYLSQNPDDQNSLNNNIINSIYEDEHNLWVGTAGGGLNRYNKSLDKFFSYPRKPDHATYWKNNDYISAIVVNEKTNEIWLGSWGNGLQKSKYSNSSPDLDFQTYFYNPEERYGPPFIYISSLAMDNDDNLWVGQSQVLNVFDAKKNTFYDVLDGTAYGNQIRNIGCLYLDSRNYLWVGTTTGLNRIKLKEGATAENLSKPDSIFHYEHNNADSNSLAGNFIVSIHEDALGNMWFSTYGHGLCRLDSLFNNGIDANFSNYTSDDGLSNNVVYGILEDSKNNLWLSTDNGLTKFNYLDSTTTTFYKTDGLQDNQFYWSAYHKNNNGLLYFGGTKGLNYFYPDSIKANTFAPKVVITDFKLFNKSLKVDSDKETKLTKTISETEEIKLSYKENILSFEFSALSYFSPKKNQYKYMMEGFDDDWITTNSERRYITYTNLNPGTYHFKVSGSNNDGLWSENPATIKLIIKPPWWKTLLFKMLAILTVGLLIFIIIKFRVKDLEEKQIELEKIVNERTSALKESNKQLKTSNTTKDKLFTIIAHDLKNPFNSILGLIELISIRYDSYDDNKKKKMLTTVLLSCQNLFKLLENLLQWSKAQNKQIEFKPEVFTINDILWENVDLYKEQANAKDIEIYCDCDDNLKVYADINLLNIILRNLIHNAIKFTEKGSIILRPEKNSDNSKVIVNVIDTGVGISKENLDKIFKSNDIDSSSGTNGESGTGLGLVLCKEFISMNKGDIWIESEEGKGSCFSFTLPVGKVN